MPMWMYVWLIVLNQNEPENQTKINNLSNEESGNMVPDNLLTGEKNQ